MNNLIFFINLEILYIKIYEKKRWKIRNIEDLIYIIIDFLF